MKKKFKVLLILSVFLLGLEVFLREYLGFCDTVLIKRDTDFEYIASPNQNRFRLRNYIEYNSFSMRSEPLSKTSKKILGFGDSVINGGVQTDQKDLATTILSDTLSKLENQEVQFLNISAGSWGPDNCFAYLKKYGDFNCNQIFLFVSSHDAFDNMSFDNIVGVNPSFPDKQYSIAIIELVERYLIPGIESLFKKDTSNHEVLGINKRKKNTPFNTGFKSFLDYTNKNNIPFTIYLHADQNEIIKGKYNKHGQEIISFAKTNNIKLIQDLDNGLKLSDFRDEIHINAEGQKKLAHILLNEIQKQ